MIGKRSGVDVLSMFIEIVVLHISQRFVRRGGQAFQVKSGLDVSQYLIGLSASQLSTSLSKPPVSRSSASVQPSSSPLPQVPGHLVAVQDTLGHLNHQWDVVRRALQRKADGCLVRTERC